MRRHWRCSASPSPSLFRRPGLISSAFLSLPSSILPPLVAYYVSQSAETEDRLEVAESVSNDLRKIARRTWRYFDTFTTAEQNHLPPDNVQETPHVIVATPHVSDQ